MSAAVRTGLALVLVGAAAATVSAQPVERAGAGTGAGAAGGTSTAASTAASTASATGASTASATAASTAAPVPASTAAAALLSITPNLTAVAPPLAKLPDVLPPLPPAAAALPKKDRVLLDKRARAALGPLLPVTAVGAKPSPILNLFHRWTEEYLPIALAGELPSAALQNRLLRDHYTNRPTQMAHKLIPAIVAAARSFRVQRADIVSGYRHPKYNLILRKKGHQVARDSEHSHGQAVDFRLPGVTTEKLADWALGRRMGGVGIYLQSQFVHIDVGKVRRWSGE